MAEQAADAAGDEVALPSRIDDERSLACSAEHQRGAQAGGTGADDLLGSSPPRDPRVRARPRSRDGLTMWPLTRAAPAGGLQAYKINVSATRRTPPDPLRVHEGHDWLYVLDGRLRLLLGAEDHTIGPGEAVEFSTWTPTGSAPSPAPSS